MIGAEREALRAAMQLPYPSFPCLADKHPACPHGFKDGALPERGLATLWLRHPGVLVGVPTGPASGLAVLDIDRGKGGGEWWTANKPRLPATRLHRTRSGGIHALFKHRACLRNSVSRIARGIDVRADGGYIIWWPAHGFPVDDRTTADWPEWLKPSEPKPVPRLATDRPRNDVAAVEGIVRVVAQAPQGQRNRITFWGACKMRENVEDGVLAESLARDLLLEAASRNGLMDREAARTIKSAFEGRRG